jgi:hypothetical protein
VKKRRAQKKDRAPKTSRPKIPKGKLPEKRRRAAVAFVGEAKGNKTKAMRQAGYTDATAEHHQDRVFDDPRTQGEIRRLLDAADLSDSNLVTKLKALTTSEVTHFYKDEAVANCSDNKTRLEAVRLALELRGHLRKHIVVDQVVTLIVDDIVPVILQFVPEDKRAECSDAILKRVADSALN